MIMNCYAKNCLSSWYFNYGKSPQSIGKSPKKNGPKKYHGYVKLLEGIQPNIIQVPSGITNRNEIGDVTNTCWKDGPSQPSSPTSGEKKIAPCWMSKIS